MKNYKTSELKNKLTSNGHKIILFGAGDIGELVKYALNQLGLKVDYYVDNDKDKHGKKDMVLKFYLFKN